MAPDQPTLTLDFITALPNLVDGVLPALLTSIGSDGKNQRAGFIESCCGRGRYITAFISLEENFRDYSGYHYAMTYPAEVDTIGFINLNPLARNILTMPGTKSLHHSDARARNLIGYPTGAPQHGAPQNPRPQTLQRKYLDFTQNISSVRIECANLPSLSLAF